jgi:hypothetical protein
LQKSPQKTILFATTVIMENEFVENFKVKDGLGCSASVEKAGVGLKMIAFNNAPIPMTVEGFERKNMSVVFTVINTTQEGFSKVPYENVNGKTKVSCSRCVPWAWGVR